MRRFSDDCKILLSVQTKPNENGEFLDHEKLIH